MFDNGEIIDIPYLFLRDIVVFPHMVVPLYVGREKSIAAVEKALKLDNIIFCVTQRDEDKEEANESDIHSMGTIAKIPQVIKLPDGSYKILVEGVSRAKVEKIKRSDTCFYGSCEVFTENMDDEQQHINLVRALYKRFEQFSNYSDSVNKDVLLALSNVHEPGRLCDLITLNLSIGVHKKQAILDTVSVTDRVEKVITYLHEEVEWMKIDQRIHNRVRLRISRDQEKYYKHQKLKAIQEELGDGDIETLGVQEHEALQNKIYEKRLPTDVHDKAMSEVNKLKMMAPMSAEATVIRMFLEWILELPWNERAKLQKDLTKSKKILDQDHYGLEKVKDRIMENLAVQTRVGKLKGPVICLVGPPGVGKTSLGRSIADALGRPFVRISLGGVRDESEIRGHRKTYIGAMPGRLIKAMKRAKVTNPLIMLDEIDKMGMDYRGDPASALLEVLDPEQNKNFSDHYLEVEYDLSNVLFITTANSMEIPVPLLDRMEIIRIPGYTENEKVRIAKKYLIPTNFKKNGVKKDEINMSDGAIAEIIRRYSKEAGVRDLDRKIDKITRKVIHANMQKKNTKSTTVTKQSLKRYLGVPPYDYGVINKQDKVGLIRGLAWTSVGGELLTIEALTYPGKGGITYTGSLGDVMKESISTAYSLVKARANQYNVGNDLFKKIDVHVHVPEGATPKDGPSAGIGMCAVVLSALAKLPIRADVALTGEVTLGGDVLAIGGLKEKLLAALRGEIHTVIIPYENTKDIEELPSEVKKGIKIHAVKTIDEVFAIIFAQNT